MPARLPWVLAKSAADLDVLTGGRVALGLGAGRLWDCQRRLRRAAATEPESVDALEEAIAIIRAVWAGERDIRVDGEHYRVHGARGGPVPARRDRASGSAPPRRCV